MQSHREAVTCGHCQRTFQLQQTAGDRQHWTLGCPFCRKEIGYVQLSYPKDSTRPEEIETETGPVRSLTGEEPLWHCCRCGTVFIQPQMCPVCTPGCFSDKMIQEPDRRENR